MKRVTGKILWANLNLLFCLSLVPFVTGWMGENHFKSLPVSLYGVILLMAAVAYYILQTVIIKSHGTDSILARAVGKDFKGKISPILYLIAIGCSWISGWIAGAIYMLVAFIWLVPDRRIEVIFNSEKL